MKAVLVALLALGLALIFGSYGFERYLTARYPTPMPTPQRLIWRYQLAFVLGIILLGIDIVLTVGWVVYLLLTA